ncbi:putative bolA-like protein C8C9.11 [Grifola frondosa]|uniref:Putative bolA-like protein C8C9.11 n=1 Tax=Grifola frondosa TaxID=5627 RepID=A0A1C7MCJ5_GRIFR|nr:putative bolA-like protein C8C9.11 [Grifola frondosa]
MPISLADLETAIRTAIPVSHLEIIDQSSGCGENYAVLVAFEGKNTLARHRFINEILKTEIAQMHAFSQKTLTPQQYQAQLAKAAA